MGRSVHFPIMFHVTMVHHLLKPNDVALLLRDASHFVNSHFNGILQQLISNIRFRHICCLFTNRKNAHGFLIDFFNFFYVFSRSFFSRI